MVKELLDAMPQEVTNQVQREQSEAFADVVTLSARRLAAQTVKEAIDANLPCTDETKLGLGLATLLGGAILLHEWGIYRREDILRILDATESDYATKR